MELRWRSTETIELVDGYVVAAADGELVSRIEGARIAPEGGFLHISVPGSPQIEIVSAPALRRIVYREN